MDKLEDGLKKLRLYSDRTFSLLTRYIEEIELFNPAYGLVKVKDREELIVRHILDSIAPVEIIKGLIAGENSGQIADIGSGAGLPGIPLAICMPKLNFTLVERMGRRAGFLRNTLALLGLANVFIEEAEMEIIASREKKNFDVIVFRAFKPLDTVLVKNLFKFTGVNNTGIIAAYKGRKESINEEMDRLFKTPGKSGQLPAFNWEIMPLEVPFLDEERHILLIKPGQDK